MKNLTELLDYAELESICNDFANTTGLGISFRDALGNEMFSCYDKSTPYICEKLKGRDVCNKNVIYGGQRSKELGEPYIYVCGCGFVMCASAIMLGDEYLGEVLCGPAVLGDLDDYVLDEISENEMFTSLSESERFDIAKRMPQISCEKMTGLSRTLFRLISYMCKSRGDYLEQRQEITKQQSVISVLMSDNKSEIRDGVGFYSSNNERKLLTAVRLGDISSAKDQLNSILADIFLYSGGNDTIIKAKIFELTGYLFRTASEAGADEKKLSEIVLSSYHLLEDKLSFEELCYESARIMEKFINSVYEERSNIKGVHYLALAMKYITNNYANDITLEKTANEVNISSSYLSHLLHDGLGTTFTEYISKLRVEKAKELLVGTDFSISEIAEKVGIPDANYFARVFKKYVGISPNKIRSMNEKR